VTWLEEASQSLHACWLLLLRDASAYRLFNSSESGFWRSFSAVFLVAPLYLYASTIETRLPDAEPVASSSPGWALIGLLLQWGGWPLIMAVVARWIGLSRNYARYIIAYNWSSVLVIAGLLPPLMLYSADLVGSGTMAVLSLFVLLASLYYRWFIARTALETTGLVAVALVLGDLVLSVLVHQFVD